METSDMTPQLATSYEIFNDHVTINGKNFPFYIHSDGPVVEEYNGFQVLHIPVLILEG